MPEIRIDPLSGERCVIAEGRAQRPGGELEAPPAARVDAESDPFAPGREDQTPPELWAVRPAGGAPDGPGWIARAVPNRYPAFEHQAPEPAPQANVDLFGVQAARGAHEVIVNAPEGVGALAELEPARVASAVEAWRTRMRAHAGASCLHLVVNERPQAGASLGHSHAQLFALPFVPAAIARERERFGAYAVRTMGANLLADLLQEEVRRRERIVAVDDEAVLLAPWASRLPYQLLLAPRRPRRRFEEEGAGGAALLHDALRRLAGHFGTSPPLNLWVRTAPRGAEHFCWRIDILPRLVALGGLELGAGLYLNPVAPERVAAQLRSG